MPHADDAHDVPWIAQLEDAARERMRAGLTRKAYAAGSFVCHKGDRLPYWTGVESGLIKLAASAADGRALSFAGVGAGGWFGEGSMLKDEPRKYDIVALRDTTIGRIDLATFRWLTEHSLGFNRVLVRLMNERMAQFIATIELDRIFDPTARVARHIAWLCNPVLNPRIGTVIDLSQEELALLAGVSRATANKALQALDAEGLIRLSRAGFSVLAAKKLATYADRN